jgi:hypothetical protein
MISAALEFHETLFNYFNQSDVTFFTGCPVYIGAKQPDKKDIDLFKVGTSGNLLLAEFGLPTVSEARTDGRFKAHLPLL